MWESSQDENERKEEMNRRNRESLMGNKQDQKINYLATVKIILTNYLFLCTVITISSIYFVVTGLQFWISDYLRIVIKVDPTLVYSAYAFISITAPILGVAAGGKVCNYFGGYSGEHALLICLFFAGLGTLLSLPIPFLNNFYLLAFCLWITFFCGGALLPILTGLLISSIPKPLRNIGNSVAQFLETLFGYMPAPGLYGLLNDIAEDSTKSRNGIIMLMFSSIIGLISLSVGYYFQKKYHKARISRHSLRQHELKQALIHRNNNTSLDRINDSKSYAGVVEQVIDVPSKELHEDLDYIDGDDGGSVEGLKVSQDKKNRYKKLKELDLL